MDKEFLIENLTDEEINRLFNSDTSIDWVIDDLDRSDIVVYSESSVFEIMLIIRRGQSARNIYYLLREYENIDVIRQSDPNVWYTIFFDGSVTKHICGNTECTNINELSGDDYIIYINPNPDPNEASTIGARKRTS